MSQRMDNSLDRNGQAAPKVGELVDPAKIIVQGVSRKHPLSWGVTPEGNVYLDWPLNAVFLAVSTVRNLVGVKNADRRVVELAQAMANDEVTAIRRCRLEGILMFLQPIMTNVKRDLVRLRTTKDRTPRLERYAVGRTELPAGEKFSLAMFGDVVPVLFWGKLFCFGCLAEIIVGMFNINRAEMEDMTGLMAWLLAYLPFLGTFAALKWLDPGDIDRDRHNFYKWLTRAALLVTPVGMYLFSAKLDALTEIDWSQANPGTGPSYTWVIWTMQISFAVAIYLSSIKLGDAWFRFLGYDVRKTREFLDVCDDIATGEDAWRSLNEIFGRVQGAIQAIDARKMKAIEQYKSCFDQCVEAANKRRRIAEATANAAAAKARLESENASDPSDPGSQDATNN